MQYLKKLWGISSFNILKILKINKKNIFFTLSNVNFNTIINSSIASLWVTNQEFSIDLARLSENLSCLSIKNLRIINIVWHNDKTVQIDKVENIYCIQFDLPTLIKFMSKHNVNEFLHNTLFIVDNICWWHIVGGMKNSTNAISVSGGSNNKRHLASRLDTRLISYMLAISDLDMHTLNALNAFDTIEKDIILPIFDYSNKKEISFTNSSSPVVSFPIKLDQNNQKAEEKEKENNNYTDDKTQELIDLTSSNDK